MSYTGDLSDPGENLYTLDYYLKLAEQIVDAGAHVLAIKDMAGLLRPQAATALVGALRSRFDLPVHVHTSRRSAGHLSGGVAGGRGRRRRRRRAPLAGTTTSPRCRRSSPGQRTEYDTGLSLSAVCEIGAVLGGAAKGVRALRVAAPALHRRAGCITTRSRRSAVDLRQQAIALGLGDRFEQIEENYAAADRILGRLVKVTPSSKVVGDLALSLVGAGVTADEFASDPARFDIPDSVIGFLRGELGDPPAAGRSRCAPRRWPGGHRRSRQKLTPDDEAALALAGPKRQAEL